MTIQNAEHCASGSIDYGANWAYGVVDTLQEISFAAVEHAEGKVMTITGYKIVWENQLPNLSERIKANWYAQVNSVATAETESAITEAALIAKGYVLGILDAEGVDEAEAGILGGILVHIENEAKARVRSKAQS
ncbi:hypothetical protein [Pseudomonas sp. UMAB-40]|uniref:hypothetical protein n=1 Tax=Pseudomonas sp. UMAB-40 TaxID=1365407 RepID=UPI001C57BA9F|nr:hypothetical protein [Pseudomonas sp. UMAB-40]